MTDEARDVLQDVVRKLCQDYGGNIGPSKGADAILAALTAAGFKLEPKWECKAQKNPSPGGIEPQDCDWPWCGCDPAMEAILKELPEHGLTIQPERPRPKLKVVD